MQHRALSFDGTLLQYSDEKVDRWPSVPRSTTSNRREELVALRLHEAFVAAESRDVLGDLINRAMREFPRTTRKLLSDVHLADELACERMPSEQNLMAIGFAPEIFDEHETEAASVRRVGAALASCTSIVDLI